MSPAPLPADILETLTYHVVQLCTEAGEAILEVYNRSQGFDVDTKADDSPVTEADLAGHAILAQGLPELLADTPVLSEESALPRYEERRKWHRYWLVDPLDGTKEFVSGNGEFTVNVALIEQGVPVLGVVHVPVLQTTYTGTRGMGAVKHEKGLAHAIHVRSIAARQTARQPIELVASRRHGAEAVDELLGRVSEALGPVETKNMGSSLKLCLVAEGEADLYPRLAPTSEWDTAAAQAVVEAAGGVVVDPNFEVLRYNTKEDILNPHFYVIGDQSYDWRRLLS
ncbi:3'(2'),5'-bisphosphate nucleotidase CysQ [Gilvimarinus sp. F26214L]|uniref:3'(2'),5'-bisphosphate nucleotidase CysQ n=1 Tax=Gilvimarinus sp. DZF01 TaxID=3461371 RepID=UPI0040457DE9